MAKIENNIFVWGHTTDLKSMTMDVNHVVDGQEPGDLLYADVLNTVARNSSLISYSLIEALSKGPIPIINQSTSPSAYNDSWTSSLPEGFINFNYLMNDENISTFATNFNTLLNQYLKYSQVYRAIQANSLTTPITITIADNGNDNSWESSSLNFSTSFTLKLPATIKTNLDMTLDNTHDLFLTGVTSGATSTLKRNSGVSVKNGVLSATNAKFSQLTGDDEEVVIADNNGSLLKRNKIIDNLSATYLSSSSNKLVTERTMYYALPSFNGSKTYTSSNSYYAPITGGTSGQILQSNGTAVPQWVDFSDLSIDKINTISVSSSTVNINLLGVAESGQGKLIYTNSGLKYRQGSLIIGDTTDTVGDITIIKPGASEVGSINIYQGDHLSWDDALNLQYGLYSMQIGDNGFTVDLSDGQPHESHTNLIQVIRGTSESITNIKRATGSFKFLNNVEFPTTTVSSDLRLKENIKEYKPEKSILDLEVKEFDLKSDGSHHIGCIAQELEQICPEIVHKNEDGYLSIEETKIVYLLLDEVKKLKKEIEELKNK